MVEIRSDIVKASALAIILALSLAGAAYILNTRIGTRVPTTTPATLEAYTPRGTPGTSVTYYYNETVSIVANVKDTWENPIANAGVKFETRGPPNSNITVVRTATTNTSGFAVTNLVPNNFAAPQVVIGVWNTLVSTQVSGSNITGIVTFEVKPPPIPYIDVYTDRGGIGLGQSSGPYMRNETVFLYAKVNNGTGPVTSVPSGVLFTLTAPNSQIIPLTAMPTNATGIAKTSFRIPFPTEFAGVWQVVATVKVNDQVLIDALTFECT